MSKPKIIAFYLPQYHPIEENNKWFGEGFTEWTNVGKAKPLFKGHYQPKVPADLGYYDLRIPDVRNAQAKLAKEAGIDAFCYYHYWFGNGRVIMEKPLEMVVDTGEPDFPFCLCWANHSFYKKNWNNDTKILDQTLLIKQEYPGEEDIKEHFNYILKIIKDPRYYKIDGRLVFVIYDFLSMGKEYFQKMKKIWNDLADKNKLPKFYFIGYTYNDKLIEQNIFIDFDQVIFTPTNNVFLNGDYSQRNQKLIKVKKLFGQILHYNFQIKDYKKVLPKLIHEIEKKENVIPILLPNWDTTPRRGFGASILKNSTPEMFSLHIQDVLRIVKNKKNPIIFIKSWNEWGEGNYMEPDLKFGKGYLKTLLESLVHHENSDK